MPLLGGALVLALASIAAYFIDQADRAIERQQAERAALRVEARINSQVQLLDATLGLFRADGVPSRTAFRAFLSALDPARNAPGMQGLGFARLEREGDTPTIQLLEDYYSIGRNSWPVSTQTERYPIVLLEPGTPRNLAALGFDMYAEPVRRAAMQKSVACNCTAASDIVELVQEISDNKQPGFLVYKPYYAMDPIGISPTVDGTKSRRLVGFVYAPFRVHDLMQDALAPELDQGIAAQIYSGPNGTGDLISPPAPSGDFHRFPIHLADREWTLDVSIPQASWAARAGLFTFILGCLLAPLVAFLLWVQARRTEFARALADERHQRTEDQRLMMDELAHRQKNSIARVNSLISLTSRETDDVDEFRHILEGRVAALAAAQKQLLTSGDAGELKAMICEEINRTGYGKGVVIEGPSVIITDRQSQPLALTFHELVTNSVKYGALRQRGMLAVSWQETTTEEGAPCVRVNWHENGLDGIPEAGREGFGTKLIRSLIERQLKGRFIRTAENGALITIIEWPR